MEKNYHKLVSFILLLFLVITTHHYSSILYNKISKLYENPSSELKMILPATFIEEEGIKKDECCKPVYCTKTSQNNSSEFTPNFIGV